MMTMLFICGAVLLGLIILGTLGPIIGLIICGAIVYYSAKKFTQTNVVGWKIFWAIIGFLSVTAIISDIPGIIGVIAIYLLYTLISQTKKKENNSKNETKENPFEGFEREWNKLNKKINN